MFVIIEEGHIVLRKGGIYRQAKVYVRNGYIYAGYSGGFIRLLKHEKGTSCPHVTYDELHLPFEPEYDSIGILKKPVS